MESSEDRKNHENNLMYYNQIIEERGTKRENRSSSDKVKKSKPSFGSQKVELSDYLAAPDGYESVVYPLYFLLIPYAVGAVLLFFFVAGASIENFKLIEFNSFLVVWMIGYEVVATFLLIAILVAFLRYDDMSQPKRHF